MTKLNQINICYLPNDLSLKLPGDRRRFVFFARYMKISYETKMQDNYYQLIYCTYGNNLSKIFEFIKKHPKTKLIFEMIDANLSEGKWINFLKGCGRFILGKESRVYLNYQTPLKKIIKKAHAVVCASAQQAKILEKYNKNILITTDFFDDEIKFKKRTWIINKKKTIRLFWEGMIYNLKHLLILNEVYKYLDFRIHVVIVTDLKKPLFLNMFGFNAKNIAKDFKFSYKIYEWRKVEVSKIAASCDLGIIPLNLNDIKASSKPENKLIFMWKIGLPVIASATAAYKNTMKLAGVRMYAKHTQDWINILNNFYKLKNYKYIDCSKKRVNKLIKKNYSTARLAYSWSKVFKSVGFKI
jgi:hypothetical protein